MNARTALDQMEQTPMLRADPLPNPVNPWEFLGEEVGAMEIDQGDPLWPRVLESYRRFASLANGCRFRTTNRLHVYMLGALTDDPAGARALVAEMQRALAIVDPDAAKPRLSIRDAVAAMEKPPAAAEPRDGS